MHFIVKIKKKRIDMSEEKIEKPVVVDPDFAQASVPMEQRRGFCAMFVIMMGFTFFSASMWVGATLGCGLTLKMFILTMLAGNLVLGIYTAFLAWIASSSGLSVHLLARRSFGKLGSKLPSFLLAFTQIGWFGVGVAMCAFPIQKYLEEKGIAVNIWPLVLVSGILFISSAYFGIKALAIISIVAVPLVAIGGCYSALRVFTDNPDAWNTLSNFKPTDPEKALTFTAGVAAAVGSFVSGGTCTPDFVRFAKSKGIAVSTTALAFFIGNSLMFTFGAVGGMFFNTNDISDVLVAQGLLVPGIIVLVLNIWTTNDNALYTSGLGLSNITGLKKKHMVLICGILGTLTAVWLYNNFCGFLNILNTTLPSIGAVLIADYFFARRKFGENGVPMHGIPAIVAWACGTLMANFVHWGITSVNGIIVAIIVYAIFVTVIPAPAKEEAAKEADK